MKMLGRLGHHGQCDCCCGQDSKAQVRARERAEWLAAAAADLLDRIEAQQATPAGQAQQAALDAYAADHDGRWPDSVQWFAYHHGFGPDPLAGYWPAP